MIKGNLMTVALLGINMLCIGLVIANVQYIGDAPVESNATILSSVITPTPTPLPTVTPVMPGMVTTAPSNIGAINVINKPATGGSTGSPILKPALTATPKPTSKPPVSIKPSPTPTIDKEFEKAQEMRKAAEERWDDVVALFQKYNLPVPDKVLYDSLISWGDALLEHGSYEDASGVYEQAKDYAEKLLDD